MGYVIIKNIKSLSDQEIALNMNGENIEKVEDSKAIHDALFN